MKRYVQPMNKFDRKMLIREVIPWNAHEFTDANWYEKTDKIKWLSPVTLDAKKAIGNYAVFSVWEGTRVYKLESQDVYVDHLRPDESGRFVEGMWNQRYFDSLTSNILIGTIKTDFTDEFISTITKVLHNMPVRPASTGSTLWLYLIKFKINDFYFIVGYLPLFSDDSKKVLKNTVDDCYVTKFYADPGKYKPGILHKIEEE